MKKFHFTVASSFCHFIKVISESPEAQELFHSYLVTANLEKKVVTQGLENLVLMEYFDDTVIKMYNDNMEDVHLNFPDFP